MRDLEDLRGAINTSAVQPYISIKGGDFRAIDSLEEEKVDITEYDPASKQKFIDVIIVDVNPHDSRLYYEDNFDESNPISPACFSDNGTGPSVNAASPQAPTCRECEHSKWGTDLKGGRGKACRDLKKIAVIVPSYRKDKAFLFKVPPTSLAFLSAFTRQLTQIKIDGKGALPIEVMTRIAFSKEKLFAVEFKPLRPIRRGSEEDQALFEIAKAMYESGETEELVGTLDTAVPTGRAPLALPAPEPRWPAVAPPPASLPPRPHQSARPSSKVAQLVEEGDIADVEFTEVEKQMDKLPPRRRRS